jgi:hypothetical protein
LKFDKPHFIVKLHPTLLEVDLKHGLRKKLETAIEANPMLRDSLGLLFQTVVPLDVQIKDIDSATLNEKGEVKIAIPHRKDLTIPLKKNEAKKLVNKLNAPIPIEKDKEINRILASRKSRAERAIGKAKGEFAAEEEESRGA